VFDELPPLFQTASKVLTIATRSGFYELPRGILLDVLNRLIADDVEDGVFNIILGK